MRKKEAVSFVSCPSARKKKKLVLSKTTSSCGRGLFLLYYCDKDQKQKNERTKKERSALGASCCVQKPFSLSLSLSLSFFSSFET